MSTCSLFARCASRYPSDPISSGHRVGLHIAIAVLFAVILPRTAAAASYYWTGDHDNNWNTTGGASGTNWSTNSSFNSDTNPNLPGSGDNVFFDLSGAGNLNNVLGANFSINSLNFMPDVTSAVTIGGGNLLTLGAGGLVDNAASSAAIALNTNVAVGATEIWANNSTVALTVGGSLSGSSNLTLEGTGALSGTATGGFVFSGADTYSGQITLANNQTSLTINGSNGSLVDVTNTTAGFTLNGGSSLIVDNTAANIARLASTVGIASKGGTISLIGNSAVASSQTVGTLTLGSGQTLVSVTGSGPAATLTFGTASVPSFSRVVGSAINFSTTGSIAVPDLSLDVGALIGGWATIGNVGSVQQDSIGSGNVLNFATVTGGNVAPASNYANVTTNSTASFVAGNNVKVSAAGVTLTNGTTSTVNSLYLTGPASVIVGTVGGTTTHLIITDGGIISNAATTTYGGSGPQIQMTDSADLGSGVVSASGAGGGAITGTITAGTGAVGTVDLVVTTASNLRIDSTITNNGSTVVGLTKDGSGTLDLSDGNLNTATNTYTGITTINAGLLVVRADVNLGTAPAAQTPNSITFNGGELRMTATFPLSANRGITVGPQGGTISYNGGNTTQLASYQVTGNGSMTYSDIPGFGGVSANLCAMQIEFGATNYTGGTTFFTEGSTAAGIDAVIFFGKGALGAQTPANNQVPANSPVTVTNMTTGTNIGTGVLNLFGSTQTFGSLAGNGTIANGLSTAANLTVGQDNLSTTYSGNLGTAGLSWGVGANSGVGADKVSSSSSNITLTKIGTGTMTMSGTNGYTGATAINGGAISVTGSLANTAVTVGNGSTLSGSLAGSGTIAGAVTVTSTGALAPAISPTTTSTLTLSNGLTLNAGATLNFNFGAAGSPGTSDKVNITAGNLLLNSGTDVLNITALSGFGIGAYNLLTDTGAGTYTDNATFTINGSTLFNYAVGTSGKNLVLTVTAGNPSYFWAGAVSGTPNGTWDIGTTANWTGAGTKYTDGGNVTFDDVDLAAGGATTITVASGGVNPNSITFNNAVTNYTFGGAVINVTSGTGIVVNQAGNATFNNAVVTPLTTMTAGSLTVGSTGSLNSTTAVNVNGGNLQVNGSLTTPTLNLSANGSLNVGSTGSLASTMALVVNGAATFNNATQTVASLADTSGATTGVVTLNGTALTLPGTSTYDGTIGGTGSLNVTGGTVTLTNIGNSYSGGTVISGGLLSVGSEAGATSTGYLGAIPATAQPADITLNGGTLQVTGQSAFQTATMNANRGTTLGASGGTINIPNAATGTFNTNEVAVAYAGVIAGTAGGNLTVTGGSGTNGGANPYLLELGGQSTYNGNTTINNATVSFFNGFNGGTGPNNILPSTTILNLVNNGWFILNNGASNQTVAGLIGDATGVFGTTNQATAAAMTIAPATGQSYIFPGVIGPVTLLARAGNTPEMSLTLAGTGTGTQILTGANTYTGATTITSGTLQLGNNTTTGSLAAGSAISIGAAGTLAIDRSNAALQGTDFSTASIGGAGALAQIGSGTTTLTAVNAYGGGTTVSAGTLTVSGAGTIGSTGGTMQVNGGILDLNGTSQGAGQSHQTLTARDSACMLTAESLGVCPLVEPTSRRKMAAQETPP